MTRETHLCVPSLPHPAHVRSERLRAIVFLRATKDCDELRTPSMKYEPIPGQPQHATEEETMAVIRAVLTEDEAPKPTRKAARLARRNGRASERQTSFGVYGKGTRSRRRADDLPELAEVAPDVPQTKRTLSVAPAIAGLRNMIVRLIRSVRAFRPSTRQLALVCLALLVVVRPQWFVISGLTLVACLVGAFVIFGSDRIWRGVTAYLRRVDARNPVRGVLLRERMDRFACGWDSILDRFPDGMVGGLYMPDLQAMESAEAAHSYAMAQRLARMAHDT